MPPIPGSPSPYRALGVKCHQRHQARFCGSRGPRGCGQSWCPDPLRKAGPWLHGLPRSDSSLVPCSEVSTLKDLFGLASNGRPLSIFGAWAAAVHEFRGAGQTTPLDPSWCSCLLLVEHDLSMAKYSRLPKKKENERVSVPSPTGLSSLCDFRALPLPESARHSSLHLVSTSSRLTALLQSHSEF